MTSKCPIDSMTEQTLKQRLERVFIIFNEQIVIAEHDSNSYHNREELMYALGIRFARNTLSSEFEEIFVMIEEQYVKT